MKVLLIGGTGVLGKEIYKDLINRDYDVVVCGRNKKALVELNEKYYIVDMSDYESIMNFTNQISKEHYDYIIFNQGVFLDEYKENGNGIEMHLMVNALSQYIILDRLLSSNYKSCIITVSSVSCYKSYVNNDVNSHNLKKWNKVYGNTKLLQLQLMKVLEEKYNSDFRYCHPGITYSPISSKLHSKFTTFIVKNLMMKPKNAVKSVIYSLNNYKKDYWCCPSGLFELIGKPKLKKIRKRILKIDEDVLKEINYICEELKEEYGL